MNVNEFQGKVAVLTGGSSGIGQTLTIQLAQAGCEVFFCGRRAAADETLAGCGERGHYFRCDLTEDGAAEAFVAEAMSLRGEIDYVVNGVATDSRVPFEKATPELFDQFVATDLKTAFRICHAALDGLRSGQ
ncbi:MAG: SDR family oxidoreductase, partial [Victivallales bacterium]|nr:SDR family oxidoreductase [Victivallales bacterium]